MKNLLRTQLLVEVVHAVDENPAARRSRDERLGPGTHRLVERAAVPPAVVSGLPQVDPRLIALQDGKSFILVTEVEAEPAAVERRRRGDVTDRHGGNRLTERRHL